MYQRLFPFLFLIVLFSCENRQEEHLISQGIYHWKGAYEPDSLTNSTLKKLNIDKQYIRFFDVDYDPNTKSPIPKSVVRFKEKPNSELIPVVFITNRTFENLNLEQSRQLGILILKKVKELAKKNDLEWQEIQLDCDWTKTTRARYFEMLRYMKETSHRKMTLSATIRLHQVKFMEQTGVPPVKRGTLMLYNVGDWKYTETKNSLFDADIIDQYIDRLPVYPLPLDIAFPVFDQTLIYRNNKFVTFLKDFTKSELQQITIFELTDKFNTFICLKDSTLHDFSFRKGDLLRYESPDFQEMKLIKQAILARLKNKEVEIIYFHLHKDCLGDLQKAIEL